MRTEVAMIDVQVNTDDMLRLQKAVAAAGRKLPNELKIVLNKTATKVKSSTKEPRGMSQRLRDIMNIKAKDLKPHLNVTRRATNAALTSQVTLGSTRRIPIREFGARGTKRNGVSYKIDKRHGRKRAKHAFMVAKYGNHVFQRETKKRLQIQKLHGISAYAMFVKNDLQKDQAKATGLELKQQITERIRYLFGKAAGRF
jgi:hypothetical protein